MTTSSNNVETGVGIQCHGIVRLSGLGGLMRSIGEASCELYMLQFEKRLEQVVRPGDKLIKLAVDKYCLLLHGVNERNLVDLAAAKLERELDRPVEIVGERLFFKINVGFAVPDGKVQSNRELFQTAESALKFAITTNQSCVVVEPGELTEKRPDPYLLPRLEQALELGEFVLYYQAKIGAAYQSVVGAEGLVRWHDSIKKEVVPPGVFIETIENSDLIKPLTETLIRSGVARCATWSNPLSVSINVPPTLLDTADVVAVANDALDFYGLSASRLILEITERGELPPHALAQLEALREIGVKISIDDFGTGQCSLSYFRDLPADEVKIDLSFVRAMRTSHKDKSIVRGCIDLAHHCGIQVVAEGVEDEATALELKRMGCDTLQGYWFGRPLNVTEFEQAHLSGQSEVEEEDHYSRLSVD